MTSNLQNKRIAKNTLFLYVRMMLVMIISLYTTRVVLHALGVEDYGIYNVICGFVSLFNVLNTCLTTGTNRFYNYAIGQNDIQGERDVFNAALAIQIIIILVALILFESFGLWYINYKMIIPPERITAAVWVFQFSVLSFCILVLEIPYSSAILAHEKMDFYAIISIIDVLLKLVFVIALQYISYDKLVFYGLLTLLTSFINFAFYVIYCRRNFNNLTFCRNINKEKFKALLSFSTWSLLDPITYTCKGQGCNMVLNAFFGPVVNAAYGIANQISGAIDGFTNNLSVSFRPQIIQSYSAGDYSRTKVLFYSMSRINYMLHLMLIIPISLSLSYILDIWLGEDYPIDTRLFAIFVMIIQTINCLHAPISTIMVATGKIKKIKTASALIICSIIPISIFLFKIEMPTYSMYVALLVLTLLNVVISVNILCKTFPTIQMRAYIKDIFLPLFFFTLIVSSAPLLVYFICDQSFTAFLLQSIITMSLTILGAYFVVFTQSEKIIIKDILFAVKRRFTK